MLENFIKVCAWCREVKLDGEWNFIRAIHQAAARCDIISRHLIDLSHDCFGPSRYGARLLILADARAKAVPNSGAIGLTAGD